MNRFRYLHSNTFLAFTLIAFFGTTGCSTKEAVDTLVINATIYTVDSAFNIVEAMAVNNGKIVATGTTAELSTRYEGKNIVDAQGKFVFPGFIDAHAHFVGYSMSLQTVDLTGTSSWNDCLARVKKFVEGKNIPAGEWIVGRGWDQNDWDQKEYPSKDSLNKLFVANPVILTRVDGHAAIANDLALEKGSVKAGTILVGGDVETKNGQTTGILIDNAVDLVAKNIPGLSREQLTNSMLEAQGNCFAKGLTTIDDCGVDFATVLHIDSLQKSGRLKMKIFAMLSDARENFEFLFRNGAIKTPMLTVRSFKVYADGALGSRGACLIEPYSDRPGHHGFLLSDKSHFDSVALLLHSKGFQMCTHAIGDSGNRQILNTYGKVLKGKNDLRWRIEHAQVVNEKDFELFRKFSIIPSVQPTHATSDMYWAENRVGSERVKGAYAFKDLMNQNGWIALGTDFPVEDIDPMKTFFAAVIRKDSKGWPANGYQMNNALSRQQALQGMTIWAARSNFEEKEKGSLEKNKAADFVILNTDIMKAAESDLLNTSVLQTFVNGESVYQKK